MLFKNKLSLNFSVVQYPSELVNIRVEKRKARLTDEGNPLEDNAWVYLHASDAGLEATHESADVLDNYLGPIFNVKRGQGCSIRWINTLGADIHYPNRTSEQEKPPINAPQDLEQLPSIITLMHMNPTYGIVTHLHGGKLAQDFDGWPLWPVGFQNNPHDLPTHRTYYYPNQQRAAMLWFHDHAMDNTAPQVFAGLAGLYFIRDVGDAELFELIGGEDQEIPLVIQDRYYDEEKQKVDYIAGLPPKTDPGVARPEFLGDTIFVNGRPWPYHELNRRIFRLRILNGSNARTYSLALLNPDSQTPDGHFSWLTNRMHVIGTEGGLLARSLQLAEKGYLTIAPGERRDVLLDLTDLDDEINKLQMVNLAIAPLARGDNNPEPIFRYHNPRILDKQADDDQNQRFSLLQENDRIAAKLSDGLSKILELRLTGDNHARPSDFDEKLARILHEQADDDAFIWDGSQLAPKSEQIAHNRFVLLMNNTRGLETSVPVNGIDNWQDTQIWELLDPSDDANALQWKLPFAVDLKTNQSPAPGNPIPPDTAPSYAVVRRTFLNDPMHMGNSQQAPTDLDVSCNQSGGALEADTNHCCDNGNSPSTSHKDTTTTSKVHNSSHHGLYAPLHKTSIKAKAGTYERWYVANIGNGQPLKANETNIDKEINQVPDMHPFHIHLVNFVVLRRWELEETTNEFKLQAASIFDKVARDDTVRINANELLELLVYYPPNYVGDYPYHCHLVEHEDMGMMLHFSVG